MPVVTAQLVCCFISVVQEQTLINHFIFISMLPSFIRKMRKLYRNVYHKLRNYFLYYRTHYFFSQSGGMDLYIGRMKKKLQTNTISVKDTALVA